MILYETQAQNDLFFTLIPLNELTARVWNRYYTSDDNGGYRRRPPMLANGTAHALDAQWLREATATSPHRRTRNRADGLIDGIHSYTPWPIPDVDAYVAVASHVRLQPAWLRLTPTSPELGALFDAIEMTTAVYVSQKEPYTSHMGLMRTLGSLLDSRPHHPNLSGPLQAFAARCVPMITGHNQPPKTHMVQRCTDTMLYLTAQALNQKGLGTAMSTRYVPDPNAHHAHDVAAYEAMIGAPLPPATRTTFDTYSWDLVKFELQRQPGARDPIPSTAFIESDAVRGNIHMFRMRPTTLVMVRLSALAALADFPHPITATQIA